MQDYTLCPNCGQNNHPAHEVCWQCQAILPLEIGLDGHRRSASTKLEPISIEDWLDRASTVIVAPPAPERPQPKPLSPIDRYLRTVFILLIATLVQMMLTPILLNRVPCAALSIGVVAVGWLYGFWPAVFCTLLGAFIADYFFVVPIFSFRLFTPVSIIQLSGYVISGFLTAFLCARYQRLARQVGKHPGR